MRKVFTQEQVERAHRALYPFSRTAWKILQALIDQCEEEGSQTISFSRASISRNAGVSYPSVWRLLPRLERAGWVRYIRRNQLTTTWEITL